MLKTLIVDDNDTCRKIVEEIIQKFSECVCVTSGEEAIDLFSFALNDPDRRFDVVLLDFEMPLMDGFDVIRAMRQLEKKHTIEGDDQVKIVMTTSHSELDVAKSCKTAGCNHYIVKPVTLTKIKDKFSILKIPME